MSTRGLHFHPPPLIMKDFLTNVVYTTAPAPSALIPSLPKTEQQILWVGCSDSQTIETDALSVPRQELFVHRNLGNQLSAGDTSCLSAIELCVEVLQVRHIIICGHYGCGLISTRSDINSFGGWLSNLKELRAASDDRLGQSTGLEERDRQLVELNVLAEVRWIMQHPSVMKGVRERGMRVHGLVYDSVQRSCVRLEISPSVDSK